MHCKTLVYVQLDSLIFRLPTNNWFLFRQIRGSFHDWSALCQQHCLTFLRIYASSDSLKKWNKNFKAGFLKTPVPLRKGTFSLELFMFQKHLFVRCLSMLYAHSEPEWICSHENLFFHSLFFCQKWLKFECVVQIYFKNQRLMAPLFFWFRRKP